MIRAPAAAPVALLLIVTGCMPALREPPSLEELARRAGSGAEDRFEDLLEQGESLWGRRSELAVRRAARAWLRAALAHPQRTEGWIGASRAMVWLADRIEDEDERLEFAESSVYTAQWCLRAEPDSAACKFWLAAAIGIQARERPSTGLDALERMVELLEQAAAQDPMLERGGPDRLLALVYLRAPGWPSGPGDPDLGLEHARRAAVYDPDHPPNVLALAEALAALDDADRSRQTYLRARELADQAARSGDPDAAIWVAEADEALRGSR